MIDDNSEKMLEVRGVSKSFYGNTVLNKIDFDLEKGEVLGLVGQNGAGKSTLVKILTGVYQKDAGTIKVAGKEVELCDIQSAHESGISIVFQELSLALNMTVADNIYVGSLPTDRLGFVRNNILNQNVQELLDRFHVDVKPTDRVGDLTIGKRQIVEIMKAVSKNPKILILDEPTSSLEEKEIKVLFEFIRELKRNGYSIIYISHHMSEVFEICDSIMILRDGNKIKACKKDEISVRDLISLMIGREYQNSNDTGNHITEDRESGNTVFEIKHLGDNRYFKDINFKISKGEILGIAGIIGCGKTELCESIYGLRSVTEGEILLNGKRIQTKSPDYSKNNGIVLLPENRKTQGLFLNDTIEHNIITCILKKVCDNGLLQQQKINKVVSRYQNSLAIKMRSQKQVLRYLSGGNQQKVLVAKCIADEPQLLIAIDPTRGIDVASKADIHKILRQLADQGLSVLVISSELDELISISNRILVMNTGKIIDEFYRSSFDEGKIMLSMHQSIVQGVE